MKNLFSSFLSLSLTILFLMGSKLLCAQDTTIVQTFTYDSLVRSAYFDFPDDEKSYEKILMIYNMRCFDAAVGNGSVGCKEWDYSCNTFLYAPEIQDSTIAFKYDYEVSGNTEDYFAYTEDTHYTYYAHDFRRIEYEKTYSENEFKISGEASPETSLNLSSNNKLIFLYTKEELENIGFEAGEINGLGLNQTGNISKLSEFRIRMKHSEDDSLDPTLAPTEGWIEVFHDDVNVSDPLLRFNFHSTFEWNGSSNILVEFSNESNIADQENASFISHSNTQNAIRTKNNSLQKHALEFGGSWGIELGNDAFSTLEDEITISFWVFGRPQDLPANTSIIEAYDIDSKRTLNIHLPWSNSSIYWDCGNNGGSYDRINKAADQSAIKGKWNHWAFTKNVTTGSMKIYLNGELWHSGESKTRSFNIQKMRLGSSVPHSLGYKGMINEFSLWTKELNEESIRELMTNSIDASHPNYGNLITYYNFEEGSGNTIYDGSDENNDAHFIGGPQWRDIKGKNLTLNFEAMEMIPDITFYQGTYQISEDIIQKIDTLISPQNSVVQYGVENNLLVALDTFFIWEAKDSKLYNEEGEELESYWVEPLDFLFFEELYYYNFKDAKFELLSLVTPYGNGLDLGPEGKTFTFDVSDFAPILKGNKRLSIELGGQKQEQLDIKFLFIEGTPSRNVIKISNLWPFARGYYQPILDDRLFEPRMLKIPSNASMAKIRSTITGHGQNGEFVSRNHRIFINENEQIFDFKVWKECAYNPIYPQGGTWIYDRAGWCPGMATDLHEFNITPYINNEEEIEVDYTVFGTYMDQANYLVSNQVVFYDEANFKVDAQLEHIVRPNNSAVEFARFNPLCSDPAVIIKNNGSDALTSLLISYGIEGHEQKSHTWTGNLSYLETEEVILPVENYAFWGIEAQNQFKVSISNINGGNDEYANNNQLSSSYVMTDVYEGYERWLLRVVTNSRAAENKYSLVDQNGNIIVERENLNNNTTYDDEITLPEGCYSFQITDSGNDGLSFWHIPAAGSGYVSIRRMENDNISFEKIKFQPDFGAEFSYDFIIDASTSISNPQTFERFSLFPNPANSHIIIEGQNLGGSEQVCQLFSMDGVKVYEEVFISDGIFMEKRIAISDLMPGNYLLKLKNKNSAWVKSFIKL